MADQATEALPSIEEIRTKINSTLKFHDRERYAASIGKLYRNSPEQFKSVINELCKVWALYLCYA